jgi:hypothetical protein
MNNENQPAGSVLPAYAKERGYILVSGPYRDESEDWMLRRALEDRLRSSLSLVSVYQVKADMSACATHTVGR